MTETLSRDAPKAIFASGQKSCGVELFLFSWAGPMLVDIALVVISVVGNCLEILFVAVGFV